MQQLLRSFLALSLLLAPAFLWAGVCRASLKELSDRSAKMQKIAQSVGLQYDFDTSRGYKRVIEDHQGEKKISYIDLQSKKPLKDSQLIEFFNSLAVPPAYTDVWYSANPKAHLQASGYDEAGRRQYRYHPLWNEARDSSKFDRILRFGQALPQLRAKAAKDMRQKGIPKEKILGAMTEFFELTYIRIGSDAYADENAHYGLSTLHDEHVKLRGSLISFQFVGKSGKEHLIQVRDPDLAKVIEELKETPGRKIFQYRDTSGDLREVHADDVNQYIKSTLGEDFSAKDYRTWGGGRMAMEFLMKKSWPQNSKELEENINEAIEHVSQHLGNTPSVAKQSYIDPRIFEFYREQEPFIKAISKAKKNRNSQLSVYERALIHLFE